MPIQASALMSRGNHILMIHLDWWRSTSHVTACKNYHEVCVTILKDLQRQFLHRVCGNAAASWTAETKYWLVCLHSGRQTTHVCTSHCNTWCRRHWNSLATAAWTTQNLYCFLSHLAATLTTQQRTNCNAGMLSKIVRQQCSSPTANNLQPRTANLLYVTQASPHVLLTYLTPHLAYTYTEQLESQYQHSVHSPRHLAVLEEWSN